MLGGPVSSIQMMTPTEIARLIDAYSAPLVLYAGSSVMRRKTSFRRRLSS